MVSGASGEIVIGRGSRLWWLWSFGGGFQNRGEVLTMDFRTGNGYEEEAVWSL